eukprot:jgi/Tetstr1/453272/TSEL_003954.t1
MRHRVRRNWQGSADIGAGRRSVDVLRNGVRIPFKNAPPARFTKGPCDYMLFMDLRDGFYAVGVAPEDRNYFTVNWYRSKLFRLAGLPMGRA